MKKIILLFSVILFYTCASSSTDEEEIILDASDRVVRFEFRTEEPNYDEVIVSYYDYKTDSYTLDKYIFEYDVNGVALPVVIILEKYDFRYISGEGYRNNASEAELSVKVYVDDELVDQDSDRGGGGQFGQYANVKMDYDAGY